VFYQKLKEEALHIAEEYHDKIVPIIPLTEQEKTQFKTQKSCHIYEKSFDKLPPLLVKKLVTTGRAIEYYTALGDEKSVNNHTENLNKTIENLRKFADHDHLTGRFRGAAHSYCNLKYKNPGFIPIFFITWLDMMRIYSLKSLVEMKKT